MLQDFNHWWQIKKVIDTIAVGIWLSIKGGLAWQQSSVVVVGPLPSFVGLSNILSILVDIVETNSSISFFDGFDLN